MSFKVHKGHVCGSSHCPGGNTDIHGPSGIQNLRKGAPIGVANKNVQARIGVYEQMIKRINGDICQYSVTNPQYAEVLKRELKDLREELTQLKGKEYSSTSAPKPKAKPAPQKPVRRAPPAHMYRSSPAPVVVTSKKEEPLRDKPATFSPASTTSVGTQSSPSPLPLITSESEETSPEPLEFHEQAPVDLSDYLVPSSPIDDDQRSVVSTVSSFDLVDSLMAAKAEEERIENERLEKERVEHEQAEKDKAIPAYLASADKVRQVYAITVSNLVQERRLPMFVEPSSPLQEEFSSSDRYNRATYYDLDYARAERALPHIRSDFKSQKERYIQERNLHNRFIDQALTMISDQPTREKLESYRVPLTLPDDPVVEPKAVTTFDTFRPHYDYHEAPAISEEERGLLEARAKTMSPEEIRAATQEHEAFLAGLQDTEIDMTRDDPTINKVVDLVKKMGVGAPRDYIRAYESLKQDHRVMAQRSKQFETYMEDLNSVAGEYQSMRSELVQRRKAEMCHFIESHVQCSSALQKAMTEFQQA